MLLIKNKIRSILALVGLSALLTMCTNNSVSEIDFLNYVDQLEENLNNVATIDGSFRYQKVDSTPEKIESHKEIKEEIIKGSYKIVSKYETINTEESSPNYQDFLLTAHGVYSSLSTKLKNNYGGFKETKLLEGHFSSRNRTLKTSPLSMTYSFNGYLVGDRDLDPGYYQIKGQYLFDQYGYPTDININYNYQNYYYTSLTSHDGPVEGGRIRHQINTSLELKIKIVWGKQ